MARLILAVCLALSLYAQSATDRLYVVTHVDLMGPAVPDGSKLLTEHAAQSMRDPGAIRYEVLVEPSRRNHITLVSVWQSREAFEKHSDLPHTRQFREKLQPMLGGPLDERLHIQQP